MACSRPTAPAMVSRSDSVQPASASTRRHRASSSEAAPPNSRPHTKHQYHCADAEHQPWLARTMSRPIVPSETALR